jgi:hypothetical protein
MAGPATPILLVLAAIAKIGIKEATKKYGKTAVNQAKKLNTKYKKTLDADSEDANYSTPQTKGKRTRTANSLSRSIKESLGPNADVKDNIKLRTLLQEATTKFYKGGIIDYRKGGLTLKTVDNRKKK